MSLDALLPLIRKSGSSLDPETFHRTVNIVFHDVEAGHYDALHAQMWDSLGEQLTLLIDDLLAKPEPIGNNLRLLDIGCGTGLATELLLRTKLAPAIGHITLLDTSAKMLEQARVKASSWGKPFTAVEGEISTLEETFDLILISSVLHHIPDIDGFMTTIDRLLKPGGILIHMQDPNGDYGDDPELKQRTSHYAATLKPRRRGNALMHNVKQIVKKMIGRESYIDHVNRRLLEKGAIKTRLSAAEIWSVTDIHVADLPYSVGKGISVRGIQATLPTFELISMRAYGFFGYLKSELSSAFQKEEAQLIEQSARNGAYMAAVWRKQSR